MSKIVTSTITSFVISDQVTLICENLFAVQGVALCLKVLDFLQTGAHQTAAGEAAGTISIKGSVAFSAKTKCNLQAVLPRQEKRKLHRMSRNLALRLTSASFLANYSVIAVSLLIWCFARCVR